MAKGRADYLLILDVDELLVPRSSHGYRNLPALIAEADTKPVKTFSFIGSEVSHEVGLGVMVGIGNLILLYTQAKNSWKGGPGFADKDGHSLCYLYLSSEVLLPSRGQQKVRRPWLSGRFPQLSEVNTSMSDLIASSAYARILLPTDRIYYTGLNSPGACRLEKVGFSCSCKNNFVKFCLPPYFVCICRDGVDVKMVACARALGQSESREEWEQYPSVRIREAQ